MSIKWGVIKFLVYFQVCGVPWSIFSGEVCRSFSSSPGSSDVSLGIWLVKVGMTLYICNEVMQVFWKKNFLRI